MLNRAAAVAVAFLLTTPVAAIAQDDGVFVDPGSPSGKEYAIPLEEARRSAGSEAKRDRVRPGERSAELFGAGVGDAAPAADPSAAEQPQQPAPSAAEAPPAAKSGERRRPKKRGERQKAQKPSRPSPSLRASIARSPSTPTAAEGDGDTLLVGGIGIGVLGLGALIGIAGRRRFSGRAA